MKNIFQNLSCQQWRTSSWKNLLVFAIVLMVNFSQQLVEAQTPKIQPKNNNISASKKNTEISISTEEFATFPDGEKGLSKFLKQNIECKKGTVNGRVYASFTVNKSGMLTDIKLIKGLNSINDKEVLRVLKLSPKWRPAKINGKPIDTQFTLPVSFSKD